MSNKERTKVSGKGKSILWCILPFSFPVNKVEKSCPMAFFIIFKLKNIDNYNKILQQANAMTDFLVLS